jgi:2-oxoisovalerate dehydrogenase E1 component beta subunit
MNDENPLKLEPITLLQAINLALHRAMKNDPNVIVLGEDIAVNGGVFRATEHLFEAFGSSRVIDMPLAESLIAGMSIGMATQGLRPVAEIQFMGFIYPAIDHIINHASRMRHRTRSRLTCPLVIRAPMGGGIHAPEHHSESTEALLAHIPGLKVVIPSTPQAAYGLLLAAIESNDPVIFLEPTRLYRSIKEVVVDDGKAWMLDQSRKVRDGHDLTLISWGAMLHDTLDAANALEKKGITSDVIDVASISPLDIIPMLESIKKTKRCAIVHEAVRTCGVGAEIIAQLQEYAFDDLSAPILRITAPDTIVPYAANESIYFPDSASILNKILDHFKMR